MKKCDKFYKTGQMKQNIGKSGNSEKCDKTWQVWNIRKLHQRLYYKDRRQ